MRAKLIYDHMLENHKLKQMLPPTQYALCFTPGRNLSQGLLCLFNHYHHHHHHFDLQQTKHALLLLFYFAKVKPENQLVCCVNHVESTVINR